jgi:hypothetical protein
MSLVQRLGRYRPSAWALVAVAALGVAFGGTALAGTKTKKVVLNKATVRQLARQEALKILQQKAGTLSVAAAANAKHADDAGHAGTADEASRAGDASSLGGKPAGAYALGQSESFRVVGAPGQPQFENSWSNDPSTGSPAAFYKDPLGIVRLRGIIEASASGNSAFFLPPGYRPGSGEVLQFDGANTAKASSVVILSTGEVRPFCVSAGCIISLDQVSFRAEG